MYFSASHKRIFPLILIFTFFLVFFSPILLAEEPKHVLPYPPRFLGELEASNNQVEKGDLMVPLYGNNDQMIHIDVNGRYGNHEGSSMGSFGGGYRGIFGDYLLGAYFFGDSNRTASHNRFQVANPGVEFMTNRWDIHLNGYIPMSRRTQLEGVFFGEQLGMTDFVSFSGHTQYDVLFNQFETVGSGVDAEVGLTLPTSNRVRVFVGGYQFRFKEAESMRGMEGGVEVPINQVLMVGVKGRTDNIQGGAAFLTVRLTLGGKNKEGPPEIQDRILDPIPRHLAAMGKGAGVPTQSVFIPKDGEKVPVVQDIWFFTTDNGSTFVNENGRNNCTFENPCRAVDYNQNNVNLINNIDPGNRFYFDPGPYPLVNNVDNFNGVPGANQLTLNRGQSMYGRTKGYLRPALDNDRPDFGGSLKLTGNHLLTNLNVNGSGTPENVGITGNGASNLVLNQVGVSNYRGSDASAPNETGGDAAGIAFTNGSNIKLTQVSVSNITGGSGSAGSSGTSGLDNPGGTGGNGSSGTSGAAGGQAIGIKLVNAQSISLENTSIGNITGGAGGEGGAGGSGGNASQSGDNRNAVGGIGGSGSTGGLGGNATGIQVDQSSVTLNTIALQQINGGVGGNGGTGGTGGAVDANNTAGGMDGFAGGSQGGTGHAGNGGSGGIGGAGGGVFAMVSNNSQVNAIGSSINLSSIQGGTGGVGGIGGTGGSADALNNVNNGVAGGGASNNTDSSAGMGGGIGGTAGIGGNGGDAVGISLSGGSFTLAAQSISLSNIQGGAGGSGGAGGAGGTANASGNTKDGYAGGSANGSNQLGSKGGKGGGTGSTGGTGGAGGAVTGILSTSGAQLSFSSGSMTLSSINGGTGGTGGSGGSGGNADANNNAGDAALGGGAAFGEGIGGTGAGNGGAGGSGGVGGEAVALSVGSADTWNFSRPVTLTSIRGGTGGTGGVGGSGGHANVQNNTGGISNAVAGGGATGGSPQGGKGAGDGGSGGTGGVGGDSVGVVNNGVLIASAGLTISQIQGGQGGSGGTGGIGENANAEGNANRGIGGAGTIGGTGGSGGGTGGTGGSGGNGGNAQYLTGNAITGSVNSQNLSGGNGGSGGIGGDGGDGKAINNGGGNTQGHGGAGSSGGTGGTGGTAGATPGQPGSAGGGGSPAVNENGGTGGSSGNGGNGGVT